jgi:hypothetical protein
MLNGVVLCMQGSNLFTIEIFTVESPLGQCVLHVDHDGQQCRATSVFCATSQCVEVLVHDCSHLHMLTLACALYGCSWSALTDLFIDPAVPTKYQLGQHRM